MTQMVCALQLCLAKNEGFMKNIQRQIYGIHYTCTSITFQQRNLMET